MYTCIIIEDEKNIRQRLKQFFPWKEFNFEVIEEACDGIEGLAMVEQFRPNLVMTDIKMPNLDGLSLARSIQEKFPETIVVILSAYSDFDFAQQAIEYNVKGYLVKPILKRDFINLMHKISKLLPEESDLKINSKKSSNNKYVIFAKKYVLQNYDKHLNLKLIADQLFINEAYFSKLFSQETGMGFNAYINQVRIEKAKELLRYSDYSLNEISIKVGFSSHSYFNRVFKQLEGISPLEFKKSR